MEFLEWLKDNQWEYRLSYCDGTHSLIVWLPEWITDNLYTARTCPEWKGNTVSSILKAAQQDMTSPTPTIELQHE